jgi:uncharacterized repeat protein (TIGR03809 family)
MTQRPVIKHELAVRGRELAERRLNYLTELYDSGRWARFHSKAELLANVREAKAALDIWRQLEAIAPPKPSSHSSAEVSGTRPHIQDVEAPPLSLESPTDEREFDVQSEPALQASLQELEQLLQRPSLLPPISFSADDVSSEHDLGEM